MIELKNITRIYKTGKTEVAAVKNISLTIKKGEFTAIMGHSGSGKSTLLNILGCLDKPDSGSYTMLGKEISHLSDDELSVLRNKMCGFVFQQFYLLPRMSVQQNVSLPLIYSGMEQDEDSIVGKITSVGLRHRINHYSNELSGGEQQRVAIARSLVNNPVILFADEPTGNLDSKTEEDILSILCELNKLGMTIVMVTHEREIAQYAGRIIYMKDGEIVSDKRKKIKRPPLKEGGIQPLLVTVRPRFKMTGIKNFFLQAISSIKGHKMRSFLSMTGILFGVASVIAMLAIGQGAKMSVENDLKSMGSNVLAIRPGSMRRRHVAMGAGAVTRLTERDVCKIGEIPEVRYVSPSVMGSAQVVYGNKNWSTTATGVGIEYEHVQSATPVVGRFFTSEENQRREKVILLGMTVARELFANENPVGKIMKVNRINFRVIGVLPEKGAAFQRDRDDTVVMPINTAMYRVLGVKYIDAIEAEIRSQDLIDTAKESIQGVLRDEHESVNGEDNFTIHDMTEIRNAIIGTTKTISLLLGIVAAISLVVGGIGIMNIMLVTVKERTREIGVRRAIGAFRSDIRIQFLIESAMLTFAGGLAGIVSGIAISLILSAVAGWAIQISLFSIVLSTSFSVLIGILFGLWPANKASSLKPVEAFRYE